MCIRDRYYPVLSFDDVEKMYSYLDNDNYPEGKKVLEIIREFCEKHEGAGELSYSSNIN